MLWESSDNLDIKAGPDQSISTNSRFKVMYDHIRLNLRVPTRIWLNLDQHLNNQGQVFARNMSGQRVHAIKYNQQSLGWAWAMTYSHDQLYTYKANA